MLSTQGYTAITAKAALQSFSFDRREVESHDVLISITHCGICHSDIHQARDEWGGSISPMVPGHGIVGTVSQIGYAVKKFKTGDCVGVGCFVDSCRICPACREGLEQYCEAGMLLTYGGRDKDSQPTWAATLRRLSWMSITCCESHQPCRLPEQPHSCARELQHTLRSATGASVNITTLQ